MTKLDDIVILEHNELDAKRLQATLRVICGTAARMRRATSLGTTIDCVIERMPDVVFCNDAVDRIASSVDVIQYLRRCRYQGPIIVVTGVLPPKRRSEIIATGGTEALHKDDLDTQSLSAALRRAGFTI